MTTTADPTADRTADPTGTAPASTDPEPGIRVVPVETFTDEEVALLSTGAPMVVSPYLDTLDDAGREAAARTAFRGLVARGVVDPPSDESVATGAAAGPDEEGRVSVDLGVRGDVMSVMTLRDAAEWVVAVARTTADAQDFWYAHVVGAVALVEEVSPAGLHTFVLAHATDLLALLGPAVVHPAAVDGAGEVTVLGAGTGEVVDAPPGLLERLGAAYLRADVVVLSRTDPDVGRPTMTGLFTGPEGSWSLVSEPATGTLTAQPESVARLHERLAALCAPVVGTPGEVTP